jgi:hypothetical protein
MQYEPTCESVGRHPVPVWFYVHWGLYSMPGRAPLTGELTEVDFVPLFDQATQIGIPSLCLKNNASTPEARFDDLRARPGTTTISRGEGR